LPKFPENYFEQVGKGGWPPISTWIRITQKNHPEIQIIGEKYKGVQTRSRIIKDTKQSHIAFISMVEPKNFNEASKDINWLKSMNEKLD
jgi:hypothetical protein